MTIYRPEEKAEGFAAHIAGDTEDYDDIWTETRFRNPDGTLQRALQSPASASVANAG